MSYDFEQTKRGTYTEPFTQTQYGVFSNRGFVGTGYSAEEALRVCNEYYDQMLECDPNFTSDMDDRDSFIIKTRTLTFSTWVTV